MVIDLLSPIITNFRYFPVAFWTAIIVELFVWAVLSLLINRYNKRIKWLLLYVFVLLFFIVLGRNSSDLNTKIVLKPVFILSFEKVANILVFVPVGGLYFYIKKDMSALPKSFFIGACCSLVFELLQLVLKRGAFETMDIITNCLGTGIGFWLYRLGERIAYNCLKNKE